MKIASSVGSPGGWRATGRGGRWAVWGVLVLAACVAGGVAEAAGVVISEVMYHPASENVLEEYVELHNTASTNVDLAGWRFSKGIQFTFTNSLVIVPGGYLVVAADVATFGAKYPGVTNVVGNWIGILSNSRQDLDLDNAAGQRVDSVEYADEGDWAVRQRGPVDRNHRGWIWTAAHDGFGASLELINPAMSNDHGQNWKASTVPEGTPGRANSVAATNIAPVILDVGHLPVIPRSTDPVLISLRLLDEGVGGLSANLHYRVDATNAPPFTVVPLHDDGAHDDGASGDGVFTAVIPPQTNHSVVEFYVEARDGTGLVRTWPAATVETNGVVLGQTANALYQVDDTPVGAWPPLYKLIMREVERAELAAIGSTSADERNSNAQMNGTFVSVDGGGIEARYTIGIRNRGHGSRNDKPNNHRVNFRSDARWKGVTALNLNAQYTHAQHLGAVVSQQAGVAGAASRPVQVRVNNVNLGNNGPQTFGGMYAANEVNNSDWAEHWFPDDDGGNIYRAMRDIAPSDFAWRGEDPKAYTNTWFKTTNVSEDDWTDLIGMLRVMGTNDLFTVENVREVVNVEQWMTHLAVMALFNSQETGLNLGYNDDYYLYAGVTDRRFILMFYDLDTILGEGDVPSSATAGIFGADALPAFNRFLHHPALEPVYYRTLQRLLDTVFSAGEFAATVEQALGSYVPQNVRDRMVQWMAARRAHVQGLINGKVPPPVVPVVAVVSGVPRSPTPFGTATLVVGGADIVEYRYRLNGGAWGAATPVATPIVLNGLGNGSTNRVEVIGRSAAGAWQAEAEATATASWVVRLGIPPVRINEVLARNVAAVNVQGTFPDVIELFNEGGSAVDVAGLRLTDNPASPGKFTLPAGTQIPAGGHLVVYANNPDGTPGLHAGFSLDQNGEGVYLFDRVTSGGAQLDGVSFGLQAADLSIGRFTGGDWRLAVPSAGSANVAVVTEAAGALRINEWLASPASVYTGDFVEVYNPSTNAVSLDGLSLTDNPIGEPQKHRFAPLSFIGPGAYLAFKADGETQKGGDHVAFQLSGEQGVIALLEPDQFAIDQVHYGPQRPDVSEGRSPNGGETLSFFLQPTPGSPNPFISSSTVTQTVTLVTMTNQWRYNQTANLDGVNWTSTGYADGAWPQGPALLYVEADPLPAPKNTSLTLGRTTYYFRTTFNWSASTNGVTLWLSPVVDDGAVFYLNGQRVLAVGISTNTPPAYATLASRNVNNAVVEGPFGIPVSALRVGENVLAVEVHQAAQNSTDVVLGAELSAITVTASPDARPVVLNEVLANNRSLTNAAGGLSDWVEVRNLSTNVVDLADYSLSDDPGRPRKWVFPAMVLQPGEHRVIACDDGLPASATNTGFALAASGEALYLFGRPAQGGTLVDSVVFGVQAGDYPIGRLPDGHGEWTLVLPTPEGENLPAALGSASLLRLNEWMANPLEGNDWFELFNPNLQPVALEGLSLSDDPLVRDKSPLPPLSFIGVGPDAYQRFEADGDRGAGADHVAFSLSAGGDQLGLYLPSGAGVDAVSFGAQATGVSEGRFPDGGGVIAAFSGSSSPAASNYRLLASVVINELLAHTDPPLEDAIEFRNLGGTAVDMGGWWLSNSERELRRFVVPANTVLVPGGYRALYEYQFGVAGAAGSVRPFTFNSAHGDTVFLTQVDAGGVPTGYRAAVEFGASANGGSFGRVATSQGVDFVAMSARSFGNDAPFTSLEEFRQGQGKANPAPLIGPVILSEVMYHPPDLAGGLDNAADEFIELVNVTAQAVPLYDPNAATNRWRLGGAVSYSFPGGYTLPAGAYLLVVGFDPADAGALATFRARYGVPGEVGIVGPWSGTLANSTERIELYRPDPPQQPPAPDAGFVPQVLVDQVRYADLAPWPPEADGTGLSLQRLAANLYGNEPANWGAAAPTAGRQTSGGSTDADADGLPDDWEILWFGSPSDPRAQPDLDVDLDGMSNLAEYGAGTNPLLATSVLRVEEIRWVGSGTVELRFTAVAGKSYTLEYADQLSSPVWRSLSQVPPAAQSGVVTLPDTPPASGRYYRVVTPAHP